MQTGSVEQGFRLRKRRDRHLREASSFSVVFDRDYRIGTIDKRIYDFKLAILDAWRTGAYMRSGHPSADEIGFRGDALNFVRKLSVSGVRCPAGSFAFGFNREVGAGLNRPKRPDLARFTIEIDEAGMPINYSAVRLQRNERQYAYVFHVSDNQILCIMKLRY